MVIAKDVSKSTFEIYGVDFYGNICETICPDSID